MPPHADSAQAAASSREADGPLMDAAALMKRVTAGMTEDGVILRMDRSHAGDAERCAAMMRCQGCSFRWELHAVASVPACLSNT